MNFVKSLMQGHITLLIGGAITAAIALVVAFMAPARLVALLKRACARC